MKCFVAIQEYPEGLTIDGLRVYFDEAKAEKETTEWNETNPESGKYFIYEIDSSDEPSQ